MEVIEIALRHTQIPNSKIRQIQDRGKLNKTVMRSDKIQAGSNWPSHY